MDLRNKRRIASSLLHVGLYRVKFDPESLDKIDEAITREGIRGLIAEGSIWAERSKGVSRGRFRARLHVPTKRGTGPGKKEGTKGARAGKKRLWILKVRALRKRLNLARERGELKDTSFRKLYMRVKGGQVRSVAHLQQIISSEKK
ncbi:MAG: 50S ribosomal protein L19e [Nitrososphaerales archaeon]